LATHLQKSDFTKNIIMNMINKLSAMTLLAGAVSGFAQGTVSMNDYNFNFSIQIFAYTSLTQPAVGVSYGGYFAVENMGNTANPNEFPAGTTTYAGPALGAGFDVQLMAAPGLNDSLASLEPSSVPITTWYSGSATTGLGGFWNSYELGAVNGSTTTATVALAAWDNEGSTINSLQAAQGTIGVDWGVSATGNISQLGGINGTAPNLPTSIESFSLAYNILDTPEPGTLALMLMGGVAYGVRRWRAKDS
jgi:PEP-CTERM motif